VIVCLQQIMARASDTSAIQMFSPNAERSAIDLPFSEYQNLKGSAFREERLTGLSSNDSPSLIVGKTVFA
jgi:hypothetical protein